MRTCPDCGRELAPGEAFCPLCGAKAPDPAPPALGDTLDGLADRAASSPESPLPGGGTPPAAPAFAEGTVSGFDAPPAKEVKPKRKAIVFVPIAAACAVALGLAVWLASGLLGGGADKRFLAAHRDLFQSMGETELAPLIRLGERERVSTDMTLTAQVDESLGELVPILNNAALRMQVDGGKDGAVLDAALDLGEDTVLEATVTGNKDGVVGFYIPQFSETYYIMDYAKFAENDPGGQLSTDDARAWEESVKTYGDILTGVVHKGNVSQRKETFFSYTNGAKEFSGTAWVFTPTAEDLEAMFARLADAMEGDETLAKLVDGLDNDILAEAVDGIRTNGPETAREIADSGFTWTIRTGKGDYGRACQIEIALDGGKDALRLERRTGRSSYDGLYFDVTAQGEELVKFTAAPTGVNGEWFGGLYAGDLWIDFQGVDGEKTSSLGFFYGSYNVYSRDGRELLFCGGVEAAEDGGTDHVIRVDGAEGTLATVTLHTTDQPVSLTFPDAPKEDITNYTAEDFEALGESWSEGVSALAMQFVLYAYQNQ